MSARVWPLVKSRIYPFRAGYVPFLANLAQRRAAVHHALRCSRRTSSLSSQQASDEVLAPDSSQARRGRGRPRFRTTGVIRTLCPTSLTPDHYSAVRWSPSPRLLLSTPSSAHRYRALILPPVESLQLHSGTEIGGFLYYYLPPHAPPLAGEVRFRITPSSNPTSFPSGYDLSNKYGTPWFISLPSIAKCSRYESFIHTLTEVDKTVSPEIMEVAGKLSIGRTPLGDFREARPLYAFGQPFSIPLNHCAHSFRLIGKDAMCASNVNNMISWSRSGKQDHATRFPFLGLWHLRSRSGKQDHATRFPFLGTVICCFEPSPLPEHARRRVVVVRVLQFLVSDPVRPNSLYAGRPYPPEFVPQAGELLRALRYGKVRLWTCDVDQERQPQGRFNRAPLKVLFDNAMEYGTL